MPTTETPIQFRDFPGHAISPVGRIGLDTPRGLRRTRRDPLRVGLLIPLCGPAGLWGPSCQCSAELAAAEINRDGGILGREVELVLADAGGDPADVAREVGDLVDDGEIDAVVGMHISAVRLALVKALRARIPYVYTPLYEGGERRLGVFATGETPDQQLRPAIAWLGERKRARRWYLIGNDYVWPRVSHRAAKKFIAAAGGIVVGESYVPYGSENHASELEAIRAAKPDAVLISLVGGDAVTFNRSFAKAGLAKTMLRLSCAIEENTLMGIGADNTENLFSSSGYFANLNTPENEAFFDRYQGTFGTRAPVPNALGESCYEGMRFYRQLARQAGATTVSAMAEASKAVTWRGARGEITARNHRVAMRIYLAQADGIDFRVIRQF